MAEQKSSSALTAPLRNAASAMRRVPGAGVVTKAAEETLDKIGAVSPRGRRMAVYAGAGVLGAAGVVEWPVALTGAAAVWLTQPRPHQSAETAQPTAAEGGTDGSAGHGAYVSMGDTAAAQQPTPGTAAPGPLRESEMPGGPETPPAAPTAPSAGLSTPAAGPAAPAEDPGTAAAGLSTPPEAPATPPTDPLASPAEETPPAAPPTPLTEKTEETEEPEETPPAAPPTS
jgi:hypothetical protein